MLVGSLAAGAKSIASGASQAAGASLAAVLL